jgi:hypothetical protein
MTDQMQYHKGPDVWFIPSVMDFVTGRRRKLWSG